VTLPLAVAIGLAIALIMRATAAATRLVRAHAASRPIAHATPLQAVLPPWTPVRTRAAARHMAARGPPAVV
jgi:hypothetical protein